MASRILDQSAVSRAEAGRPRGGLDRRLRRSVADAALPAGANGQAVTGSDIAGLPQGLVLAPWRTPVEGWETTGGRPVPGPASVAYDLSTGPYCYAEGRFIPDTVAFNVAPDQL